MGRGSLTPLARAAAPIANDVDGHLSEREGAMLFELARTCSRLGPLVEIGSYKGRSTVWLALGSRAGASASVLAVDPHSGSPEHRLHGPVWTYDEFTENVQRAGVAELVRPIVATSADARDQVEGPVGLVFIDGDHSYCEVRADIDRWLPLLSDGGVLALHDTGRNWPGPRRAARETLFDGSFGDLGFVDSLAFGTKAGTAGVLRRAVMRVRKQGHDYWRHNRVRATFRRRRLS